MIHQLTQTDTHTHTHYIYIYIYISLSSDIPLSRKTKGVSLVLGIDSLNGIPVIGHAQVSLLHDHIYQPYPLGQDMAQGQFLSGV